MSSESRMPTLERILPLIAGHRVVDSYVRPHTLTVHLEEHRTGAPRTLIVTRHQSGLVRARLLGGRDRRRTIASDEWRRNR